MMGKIKKGNYDAEKGNYDDSSKKKGKKGKKGNISQVEIVFPKSR